MRRTTRNVLFVLCLGLTLGLSSAAQAQPAPYMAIHPASLLLNVTVIGAGETLAAAEARGATAATMLGACTRGWEVLARLGLAAPGRFHAQGLRRQP
mgnify:CR=1 FL=1